MEKTKLTKSQKILFGILAVVLLYAVIDFVTHKDTYINYYTGKKAQMATQEQKKAEQKVQGIDMLKSRVMRNWGRDPFYREIKVTPSRKAQKPPTPQFELKAISYRENESVALINERIVKRGDVISGFKVESIDPRQVVLWNGKDKRLVLRLSN